MRWHWNIIVFWCGVLVSNLTACIPPSFAASQPEALEPNHSPEAPEITYSAEALELSQLEERQEPEPTLSQTQPPPPPPVDVPGQDEDQFLQPAPVPAPIAPEEQTPILPTQPAPPPTPAPDSTTRTPVERIEVVGSTIFDETDFAPITQPAAGQSLTVDELRAIADRITQLYLDAGYITSRAVLAEQVVSEGVIQIRVIEGSLERIDVEGNRRVNDSYIRSRVRLGAATPLNQIDLEEQLRLLRLDPLFENVEASLRAGSGLGQSVLTVRVDEADPLVANFNIDNYSPPSVGGERFGVTAGYRSLTGLGDDLSVSYARSFEGGSNVFDFSYRIPLNPLNGTLELRAAPSNYEIVDGITDDLDIEGDAELYELSFRQPLIRSTREEFALSLGFTYRDGETLINDFLTDASTTSVFKLGQDYLRRDPRGSWALRSQFNLGTGLFDATTDSFDAFAGSGSAGNGDEPDGQFFSWLGQVQRVQILDRSNLLIMQFDLQLTPDPLLSSQQFVIGGGRSVRGYRQNVRIGDNGFRLSVENRITLLRNDAGASTLQLAPFAEIGAVWNDKDNPDEPDQNVLPGIGLGVLWEPLPRLNVRVDFAVPLVDLDDRGEDAQDDGIYFSVNYGL